MSAKAESHLIMRSNLLLQKKYPNQEFRILGSGIGNRQRRLQAVDLLEGIHVRFDRWRFSRQSRFNAEEGVGVENLDVAAEVGAFDIEFEITRWLALDFVEIDLCVYIGDTVFGHRSFPLLNAPVELFSEIRFGGPEEMQIENYRLLAVDANRNAAVEMRVDLGFQIRFDPVHTARIIRMNDFSVKPLSDVFESRDELAFRLQTLAVFHDSSWGM